MPSLISRQSRIAGRVAIPLRPSAFAAIALALAIATVALPVHAQTFTLLYSFGTKSSTDGFFPEGDLIRDSAGNFYGTTLEGGTSDSGTLYKLNPAGSEAFFYSFPGGADGLFPNPSLVRDAAGNLYGSTAGAVFKLTPRFNTETVLATFGPGDVGQGPTGLIRDAAGNFYGTTLEGGATNLGIVFKIDTTGAVTVLYTFAGGADGANPGGSLIQDAAGNLYGTTLEGGDTSFCLSVGCGTIFKIDAAGNHTVLHAFIGTDGDGPREHLTRDSAGNLYGTTYLGGVSSKFCTSGCGVAFKLDTNNNLTVLHTFGSGQDGKSPFSTLVQDAAGNLYGTTQIGGAFHSGTVFKIDPTGKETILHSFNGATDGSGPTGGLFLDAAGNLYGSAASGGTYGKGTIFKITP